MKYYIYISDAKVEMLFPQVPHDIKKKVAIEFKTDVKVFSASRKTETESEDNRIARLEAVVGFIREYGNVGTVDDPDEYIEGVMQVRWGPLGQIGQKSAVVYFGGETDRTYLGLGGSMHHVIGNAGESRPNSSSLTPALVDYLYQELKINLPVESFSEMPEWYRTYMKDVATPAEWIALASKTLEGPTQNIEFLAKRLSYGPVEPQEYENRKAFAVLATPLYVAMAD